MAKHAQARVSLPQLGWGVIRPLVRRNLQIRSMTNDGWRVVEISLLCTLAGLPLSYNSQKKDLEVTQAGEVYFPQMGES